MRLTAAQQHAIRYALAECSLALEFEGYECECDGADDSPRSKCAACVPAHVMLEVLQSDELFREEALAVSRHAKEQMEGSK